jgi:Mg2+ and Co2+ transporter CorA
MPRRRRCRNCRGRIPRDRKRTAVYCTDACKTEHYRKRRLRREKRRYPSRSRNRPSYRTLYASALDWIEELHGDLEAVRRERDELEDALREKEDEG